MLYLILDAARDWLEAQGLYRYFRVLDQVQFRVLAAALLSFVIVLVMGRRTIRFLVRKKIGDSGYSDAEQLKRHSSSKANTPTMGGVLICASMLASIFLLADLREFYVQLGILVLVWLAVLGGFDDWLKLTAASRGSTSRQGLFAWEKLAFQLGLGVLVGYFAFRHGNATEGHDIAHVLTLPFQKTYEAMTHVTRPGLVFLPMGAFIVLTTLIMAGMSNAVNITDGMDGLAAGISAAVAVGLVVLTLIAGSNAAATYLLVPFIPTVDEASVLAGAMAGACLGFLWWNCSPAQVFMGDTGSLALGGMIGYLAIVARQEFVVVAMCGVFVWELVSVAVQVGYFKATGGKRVFRCAPYHHHLHLLGWTEQQVVARAWIVSVLLVVLALASIKVR